MKYLSVQTAKLTNHQGLDNHLQLLTVHTKREQLQHEKKSFGLIIFISRREKTSTNYSLRSPAVCLLESQRWVYDSLVNISDAYMFLIFPKKLPQR